MRSRLRTAASAISAERRSPCAAHEVRLRLLEVLERAAADRLQFALPLLGGLRQQEPRARLLDAGDGGDEIVVALHELAGFDGEQRRAALDQVAGPGDQLADPAGEGREDRRRRVLVDRDLAVGRAFVAEGDLAHRREPEARPLRVARPEGAVGLARTLLRTRHRVAGSGVEAPEADHRRRHDHGSAGRDPQAISPEARPQRRIGLRGHERGSPVGMFRETAQPSPFRLRQPDGAMSQGAC